MKLGFSARARLQLLAIHDYIRNEGGSVAADRVGSAIREAREEPCGVLVFVMQKPAA